MPGLTRFGLFELDRGSGELTRNGCRIKLQEQPLRVLQTLLDRPGEVVLREELKSLLWQEDTFVEFDQGLNTAIRKIRLALRDSAETPRFIETIQRKGYRFIAPVSAAQAAAPADPAPSPAPRRRVLSSAATASITVAVLGAAAAAWVVAPPAAPRLAYFPVPLTSYPGDEHSPTFSPDGNDVAFSWVPAGKPGLHHVYVKQIGSDPPIRITAEDADDFGPAWSPDGRFIAFVRITATERSGVFVVPALGGAVRKVGEISRPREIEPPYLAWHPNGKWLVVVDRDAVDQPYSLFMLSLDSGEKRRLTTSPRVYTGDIGPAVSPNGRSVVFSRNAHDLFLIELSADLFPKGEPKQLTFNHGYTGSPAWSPDGNDIVFTFGTAHAPSLYLLSMSRFPWGNSQPQRLPFAGEGARQPAISRSKRMAYVKFTIDANIWRLRLAEDGVSTDGPGEKLIASTRLDHEPEYSPDGRRIVFTSNRSGSFEIWMCHSDGSGILQLTSFGASAFTAGPHWSADGRRIFFSSAVNGRFEPFVIDSDGGTPERVAGHAPGHLSHDGKWTYSDSGRSGRSEIWKIPTGGGQPIQITRGGGTSPQESGDGSLVYYLKDGQEFTTLWSVPVNGGSEKLVLDSVCCQNFVVVDRGVYFIPKWPIGEQSVVQFLTFNTGRVTTLAQLSGHAAYGMSVSPDRRSLLYSQYDPKGADLMLVESFR